MDEPGRGRRCAAVLAVVAVVLALFAPSSRALFALWLDTGRTSYTHGFLVAAISVWLLWRTPPRGATQESPLVRTLVVLALAGAVLLWEWSYLASLELGGMVLLPVIAWLAIHLALGPAVARAASFPLGYLYFAIPVWDVINGLAQELTVRVVRHLLAITDIPAFVSGNHVEIRGAVFHVAEGCSGLHFIMVALALGALIGELRHDDWRARVRWLGIALALALLTNWVRVYTIILAGYVTHMQHYIVRVSHYGYGWLLFALAISVLFVFERRARLRPAPARAPAAWTFVPRASLIALALIVSPVIVNGVIDARGGAQPAVPVEETGTRLLAGWQTIGGASDWRPVQLGADRLSRERFRGAQGDVELLVASYHRISQGRELGGFENRPGGDAALIGATRRAVADREVDEQELEGADGRFVVWIEYGVGGRSFADATDAQLFYGWRTLRALRPQPAEVRLLRSTCVPDCAAARSRLAAVLSSLGGPV